MDYVILSVAVLILGLQTLSEQKFQKENGIGFSIGMVVAFGQSLFGLPILWATSGFGIECTAFTLIMAIINAIVRVLGAYFAINALAYASLSLYSVFTMLGGMMIPFIVGICFFDEALTLGKMVCLIGVTAAIAVTFKSDKKNKGLFFCIANFFINGIASALLKFFQALPYEKTDSSDFIFITNLFAMIISLVIMLLNYKKMVMPKMNSIIYLAASGIANRVANVLMLIALLTLPASVQYPMITGGVMIILTLFGLLTDKKPSKREIISVVMAFMSIMALVIL